MKSREELEAELDRLMSSVGECGCAEQYAHRQGRARSLVWVLTGDDPGYNCLRDIQAWCRTLAILGWKGGWKNDTFYWARTPKEWLEISERGEAGKGDVLRVWPTAHNGGRIG